MSKFDPSKPITQSHTTSRIPPGARNDPEIEDMFDTVMASVHSEGFSEFLSDIYDSWQRRGYLTERQYEALERAYNRS